MGRHNSTSARGMSLGSTAEAMSGVYCRGNVCCHCGLLQRHCPLSLGSTAEVMSVVTAVYCRGNVCKPIVVPLCPPAWECIHPSFKTTMQEHLLSKITCSLAESGLPHHSPQTCLRLKTRKLLGRHVRGWPHKPEGNNKLADELEEWS